MAIPADVQAALDRLVLYNSNAYDKDTNPRGLPYPGYITEFPRALSDTSTVVTYVGGLADDLTALDDIATEIQTVAAISTEVQTVAGDSAFIETAAGISSDITTVAGISADVTTVAGISASVSAVAGNETNIDAVAANAANINAVAGNETDIDTVAANISDITTAADNIAAILAAPQAATDAEAARDEAQGYAAAAKRVALYFAYDSATTDADPGAGDFRLNNAAVDSATEAYVSTTAANGGDASAWLDAWDDADNTVKGTLTLISAADQSIWAVFHVTGVTTATGYRKIALTYLSGNGTFTAAAEFSVTFDRAGDAGADGLGSGDVVGPGSAVDSNFAAFDGTTGKLIKDSGLAAASFATAAQGSLADSSLQPNDSADQLTEGATNLFMTSAERTKLAGVEAGATADQTASEILTALKTVDGSGSGLDADLLDGNHASAFATAAQGALADSAVQPADIATMVTSDTTEAGGGTAVANIVSMSQATYDGLGTPDADTLYVIV